MLKSVSILVCFYNAEYRLPKTIQHIQNLDISGLNGIEVLFIDNNSTDNSQTVIHTMFKGFTKFPYNIYFESKPGVTQARLRGIHEARYNYIVFCDDDNSLFSDYIQKSLPIFEIDHSIAAVGGCGIAKSSIQIPEWFEKLQNFYGVGPQMPVSGYVSGIRNVIYGAGMVLKKAAFLHIEKNGFEFYSVSRVANSFGSGEDGELCLALKIAGYTIWYNSEMQFYHEISSNRLTKKYKNKLQFGIATSGYVTRFYRDYIFGYKPKITRYFWFKEFVYSIKDLLKGFFVNSTKLGLRRNFHFSIYLLRERGKYNKNVAKVIEICENLSKNVIEDMSNQVIK
jgi:glycosyltransferase involved in cell wall biosynthesis